MKRIREPEGQVVSAAAPRKTYQGDDLGLGFYKQPPDVEVSVRDFEDFTANRLKILHAIDRACAGENFRLENMIQLKPKLAKDLNDCSLILGYPQGKQRMESFLSDKAEFVRRDAVSHFALRLAFCKTRDAREWFLRQEQRLFVLRFEALSAEAKEAFIAVMGMDCSRYNFIDGPNLDKLQKCTAGAKIWSEERKVPEYEQVFYALPFQEVPPHLIAGRRVMLQRGKAFVAASVLKLIVAKRFKEQLAEGLNVAFQGLNIAMMDMRVGGFLKSLQDYGLQLVAGPRTSSEDAGEKLAPENFEEFMARSFPPCMRRLVERQRENKKHLKHAGRLQLRPFLKDCGFTFEDSVRWWKQELCRDPEITSESFEKPQVHPSGSFRSSGLTCMTSSTPTARRAIFKVRTASAVRRSWPCPARRPGRCTGACFDSWSCRRCGTSCRGGGCLPPLSGRSRNWSRKGSITSWPAWSTSSRCMWATTGKGWATAPWTSSAPAAASTRRRKRRRVP
ncbi:unnamed protein product [Effrenium voratum]|uniref:DNA primase large subunit C-terminal domain-containing protein n=1 Tax=Effrenium voratum TaxID=2562239 RepID=A0AA36I2T5_9DINO|nr:unnamed protein product [Effrenium voratum]